MEIILNIDTREPESIRTGLLMAIGTTDWNVVIAALTAGDYVFTCKADGIPRLFVERKTIPDLISSINDGRFRDQRARLMETNVKTVYIIEGSLTSVRDPSDEKRVLGALENLALIHNICVIPTANEQQTITVIKNLYTKIGREYVQPANRYVSARRKSDMLGSSLERMLQTIDGISPSIAAAIAQRFPGMSVAQFAAELTDRPNCLFGIELSPRRRLGPKLAQRVSDAFMA